MPGHSVLRTVDAELDDLIASRPAAARRIAIVAAERAVAACGVNDPLISKALQSLAEGKSGDGPSLRSALTTIAAEIEAPYFGELSTDTLRLSESALAAFSRARAILSVSSALGDDPLAAARDAIYEAQASMSQPASGELLDSLKDLLRELEP